jgi:riboflavin transporter FmnP
MYIMAHIDKDKYIVQDFMSLLKGDKMMSVHIMVLNWKLAHPLSIKIKHLKQGFQMKGQLCMKQSGTQSGLDK